MHNESKLRVSKAVGPALRGSRLVQPFDNDTLSSCKFTTEKSSIQLLYIFILILVRAFFITFFPHYVAPGHACSKVPIMPEGRARLVEAYEGSRRFRLTIEGRVRETQPPQTPTDYRAGIEIPRNNVPSLNLAIPPPHLFAT